MDKFQDIKDFIDKLEPDVIKFYSKGFSSTGTRVTVGMQRLKELAHALRDDVLATKKINKKGKENKAPWD